MIEINPLSLEFSVVVSCPISTIFKGSDLFLERGSDMKKWLHASTNNVKRIEIDFYGEIDLSEDINASRSPNRRRVFRNTQIVIRDISTYLQSKGLRILNVSKSSNQDSDSTYYDIDVKLQDTKGKIDYLYLRISDHAENLANEAARDNYHDRLTRSYEGLPESENVRTRWKYKSIEITGKKFNNYDRAMNRVKEEIDDVLKEGGINV